MVCAIIVIVIVVVMVVVVLVVLVLVLICGGREGVDLQLSHHESVHLFALGSQDVAGIRALWLL